MDPISVASARFRRHPRLLLDADGHCLKQSVPPRSLRVVCLSGELRRLADIEIDLRDPTWEIEFRAFLTRHSRGEQSPAVLSD